jgi:hypothetical protein
MKLMQQLLLAAIIITLVSCKGKNALAYNEKMVGIQQELMTKVNAMQADTSGNATAKLIGFRDFAKLKRDEIKAAVAPDDAEAFKTAMLNDVNGIIDSYDVLIKITEAEGDEAKLEPLREQFSALEKKIAKLDDLVIEEQRKFAKANGIQLK